MARDANGRRRERPPKGGCRARPRTPPASNTAASGNSSGPRAKRAAERRDAILAAALDGFAARGFAAARLDDVASRAGVAKGTIYLHFADKEALFEELIRVEIAPARRRPGAGFARRHLVARR